ncbi:hypothetical protein [Streptomyces sp. NPDC001492]
MIESWVSRGGSAGRSRRAGLLIGLIVVIAAHLTGSAHACSFAGADVSAVATHEVRQAADEGDDPGSTTPLPGPHHAADGHVDHAADRPRADFAVAGPGGDAAGPPLPAVSRGHFVHAGWRSPPGVSRSCDSGSALALLCVLRQ